ncbi:MAG: SpoIID/LytB domain-containing protein [Rhabdochlamydiaceae bacterium]|nr:SpoIID/LytB domain-containing protein [Candidatus Amphrikana amoebophyrae]
MMLKLKSQINLYFLTALAVSTTAFGFGKKEVETVQPATIKVLVKKSYKGALVESKGGFKVVNPVDNSYLSSSSGAKRQSLLPLENGIKWLNDFKNIYQIRIVPYNKATTILVNGTEYSGSLEVYSVEGQLYFIIESDVEDYIKSRLTNQFAMQNLSDATMESIAISERTMAYYLAQKNQEAYWHVDTSDGFFKGRVTTKLDVNIDHAVDMTKHMILTYKGSPFPAVLTENCGGMTSNYKSIFRKNVSCPEGVESPIARKSRKDSIWRFKIHKDDLAHLAGLNRLSGVDLFMDDSTNRTYAVRIKGRNCKKDVNFFDLQNRIGKEKLQSNEFSVTIEKDYVLFEGHGVGHGIGLCLYSSEQMARRGDSTEQILTDFFPQTKLSEMATLEEIAYKN